MYEHYFLILLFIKQNYLSAVRSPNREELFVSFVRFSKIYNEIFLLQTHCNDSKTVDFKLHQNLAIGFLKK